MPHDTKCHDLAAAVLADYPCDDETRKHLAAALESDIQDAIEGFMELMAVMPEKAWPVTSSATVSVLPVRGAGKA